MTRKPKLELTWIGKDERPRLEPRILIEEPSLSHHAANAREGAIYDNMLIHGDNLLALKALEADYAGKVKCIYIDPPYNTWSAIEEYEDGLEHSLWLSMIRDRLVILRNLLRDDGSIWVNLDDNEGHYFKVLADEIFGRRNFINTIIWQKKYGPKSDSKYISESHDFIFAYAKSIDHLEINWLLKTEKQTSRYKNPDNDPRGPWKAGDTLRNEVRDYAVFPVRLPSGREVWPSEGTSWRYTREKFEELIAENRIWFGVTGDSRPAIKRFISDVADDIPPVSIWSYDEVGHNDEAKKESKRLFGAELFSTPKPERLLERVLHIGSNPGDLVLDSFAGSGTTGAVAHKMGRRWIMVELGEHAKTHIVPRLDKVVDGADPGGVTGSVGWQGGGGYRFFRLAPSLLSEDKYGNWVISKDYNAEMLTEALCKHMGYAYVPSQNADEYWKHGQSTETDFIYVTTQQLTQDACRKVADDVGPDRSLLICCKAFSANPDSFPNLTLVKIPTSILRKCEWGRDDYSLAIRDLPPAEDEPEAAPNRRGTARPSTTPSLFDSEGDE